MNISTKKPTQTLCMTHQALEFTTLSNLGFTQVILRLNPDTLLQLRTQPVTLNHCKGLTTKILKKQTMPVELKITKPYVIALCLVALLLGATLQICSICFIKCSELSKDKHLQSNLIYKEHSINSTPNAKNF